MKIYQKYTLTLLAFAAVMSLCVSVQSKLKLGDRTKTAETYTDRCLIDLASPTNCPALDTDSPLSKGNDERIVWKNDSSKDIYVCFDAQTTPFEAYAWRVPSHDKAKSGKIADRVMPAGGKLTFYYSTPSTPCTGKKPATDGTRTNPKIIIGD